MPLPLPDFSGSGYAAAMTFPLKTIALIVAVVAEMMMGGYGMGGAMIEASRKADSRGVFAGIIEISIVGWIFVKAMVMLRGRLLFWHAER